MLNGSKDAESHKDVPFWVKNETLKSAAQLFTAKTQKKIWPQIDNLKPKY